MGIDFARDGDGNTFAGADAHNIANVFEIDGKRHSVVRSEFYESLHNFETPYTDEIQALLPPRDPSPSSFGYSIPGITFYRIVVSDLVTGEISQDESREFFHINSAYSYRNDDDNDYGYNHVLRITSKIDKLFTDIDPALYSIQEIKDVLYDTNNLNVRTNELFDRTENEVGSARFWEEGYVSVGTLTVRVPEPAPLLLMLLLLPLLRRKQH